MATPDPIDEADVLLKYGREAQALTLLKQAAAANPDRSDIRRKLESLTHRDVSIRASIWVALPHLALGWVLWLFSLVLVFGLFFLIAFPGVRALFPSNGTELPWYGILLALGIIGVIGFSAAYTATVVFVHVWFAYLNQLPAATRKLVDVQAKANFSRMEPLYSRIRSKVFRASDAT